jgi:hypothetical protein
MLEVDVADDDMDAIGGTETHASAPSPELKRSFADINGYSRVLLGLTSKDNSGAFRCYRVPKLRQVDLCCAVGKEHYWGAYFYNPSIVARMRPYLGLTD